MIHLLAIAERGSRPRPPLRTIECGRLAAICGDPPPTGVDPTPEALEEHERDVEELMADGTVLPARFASLFDDEAAVREFMRTRHDEFAAALDLVRGRVELGVRARLGAARRPVDAIHGELAAVAAAATPGSAASREPRFEGAYLVERSHVPRFRRRVEELRAEQPALGIACTGPWPPYSFTPAELAHG